MCKAPVPGRVKTRLMPAFDATAAADLHAAMARRVILRALRLFPNTWIAADDPSHPFFAEFHMSVVAQGEGDLGARMFRLARRAMDYGSAGVLLLGSDSPHMSEARLHTAVRTLRLADVVLGPVLDGGYDLMALCDCRPELFSGISWGSPGVLAQTLQQAERLGLRCRCLSMAYDVDTADDVQRVLRAGLTLPAYSPAG